MSEEKKLHPSLVWLNRVFKVMDDVILIVVSLGILLVTVMLLWDVGMDLIFDEKHSVPHLISELMFALISMELFRQVIRQVMHEPFSLNPFFFIGVIASVRGILITQMKLASKGMETENGILILIAYALITLILIICYYINTRVQGGMASLLQKKVD